MIAMVRFDFKAIGTTWQIDIYSELTESAATNILSKIKTRIDIFDKAYSRFRDDSIVTKMSKDAGTFVLPSDAEPMFSIYHDLYIRTGGFFTPLVGKLLSDAGYDAQYSLQQKNKLAIPPTWDEALDYKYPNLLVKKPVLMDFGAAGKGYLIDLVAEVLEVEGIHGYCIDAGGDILHKGDKPIRVGLEHPDNKDQVIGVYSLQGKAICGSAGNRRKWADFTHIMNPKTLSSPKDIIAVWVVAEKAMVADALTTCLFFVPASTLAGAYDFEYMLVRSDHSTEKSDGFSAEVFVS